MSKSITRKNKPPNLYIPKSLPEVPPLDVAIDLAPTNDNPLVGFPKINKDDLVRISELGCGNGGVVWKVEHEPSNIIMAQKIIHLEVKPSVRRQILKELQVLQRCKSPHIIGFYGAFCCESDISICMEFMDGLSLDICLKKAKWIPEPILGRISIAVLNGLHYLKTELDILHRDVKPSNILVNMKGEIKLCDFGVSGQLNDSMANSFVGTTSYMAPERLSGSEYNVKSDVWSFGISLFELAIGRYPVPSPTAADLFNKRLEDLTLSNEQKKNLASAKKISLKHSQVENTPVAQSKAIYELLSIIVFGPAPTLPRGIFTDDFTDIVENCLQKDPKARADLKTLLKHPFIEKSMQTNIDFPGWVAQVVAISISKK